MLVESPYLRIAVGYYKDDSGTSQTVWAYWEGELIHFVLGDEDEAFMFMEVDNLAALHHAIQGLKQDYKKIDNIK